MPATTYSPTHFRVQYNRPGGLNFRVRDGNGWIPRGMITDNLELSAISRQLSAGLVPG